MFPWGSRVLEASELGLWQEYRSHSITLNYTKNERVEAKAMFSGIKQ